MPKILPDHVIDLQTFRDTMALLPAAKGLVVRNNASTPNTSVDIVADYAVLLGDAPTATSGLSALFSGVDLTINTTTTGVNGLDEGARASNTWYHHFLIWGDGQDVAGLSSLSPTAPTLPSGYTHLLRVGAAKTDASGNFSKYVQRGNVARFGLMRQLTSGAQGSIATPTFSTISLSGVIPTTAQRVLGTLRVMAFSTNQAGVVAPNSGYGSADTGVNYPPCIVSGSGGTSYGVNAVPFDFPIEDGNLYYASNVPTSSTIASILSCSGYVDSVNAS
ncbi:hypothetical protein GCM10007276_12360 [Agaricicola taiwanensis]|uniref:Uncharacterized protein n=1 Tax=Agaricicola taiwanensis TaxID=591372 RepID=A0A8J2VPK1_9RHOB|nr:hypothetical protein [Agaricicola taiwanensis]GGE36398.1 hypothetical protein GCM10007276_12360 [Agaricicola taiwanensis]